MNTSFRFMVTTATFALAFGAVVPVNAQDVPAEEFAEGAEESGVIVVTGQKRAENVQDVPKAVDVVSQESLVQANVSSIQDLSRISPAIQGSQAPLSSAPTIRGITTTSFAIGVQSQTGVVLDDIPQPSYSTLADDLTDVERVEIFAGPQSTLSGRNAAGGLVNIVTHNPTRDFELNYRLERTSDGQTKAGGYVSGPITNTLGLSVSAYYNQFDGLLFNVREAGRPINQFERVGVRAKLRWEPTENLTVSAAGFFTNAVASTNGILDAGPFVQVSANNVAAVTANHPGVAIEPFNQNVSVISHGVGDYENKGGWLRFDLESALGTLSSITNYTKSTQDRDDLTIGRAFFGFVIRQQTDIAVDYFTQEFRLVSPDNGSRFKYLLGAIYSDTDNFQPFTRPFPLAFNIDRSSETRSYAVYGRGTYEFLPTTSLTLGARYQNDRLGYGFVFKDNSSPSISGTTNYDYVTGEASLQHEFTPDVKGYLTVAKGETGQVYDTEDQRSARNPAGLQPKDSQKYEHFEAGVKTQFLGNVTFNVAAFRTTYRNFQFQAADVTPGADPTNIVLLTVGKVRTQGVDADLNWAVSRDVNFGLAAEYLDAEVLEYPGANCFPGQTAAQGCLPVPGTTAFKQNRRGPLPNTAKFRMIGTANATIPTPGLPFDLTAGAYGRYQSRVYFDLLGNPLTTQGGYAVLNFSAGIKDREGRYTAEVFVNNAFDKQFYSGLGQDLLYSPVALVGGYARDTFRYWGGRLSIRY